MAGFMSVTGVSPPTSFEVTYWYIGHRMPFRVDGRRPSACCSAVDEPALNVAKRGGVSLSAAMAHNSARHPANVPHLLVRLPKQYL